MHIGFINDLDGWRDCDSLIASGGGTGSSIAAHVGIEHADGNRTRIDVYASAGYPGFQEVRGSDGIAYLGYGDYVFVIDVQGQRVAAHCVDAYFGHLYSAGEIGASGASYAMLAASGSELLAFSRDGKLLWKRDGLGLDGVVVHDGTGERIAGSGEWDPPGGWRDFLLNAADGADAPADPLLE
jgi:hypothetical protein